MQGPYDLQGRSFGPVLELVQLYTAEDARAAGASDVVKMRLVSVRQGFDYYQPGYYGVYTTVGRGGEVVRGMISFQSDAEEAPRVQTLKGAAHHVVQPTVAVIVMHTALVLVSMLALTAHENVWGAIDLAGFEAGGWISLLSAIVYVVLALWTILLAASNWLVLRKRAAISWSSKLPSLSLAVCFGIHLTLLVATLIIFNMEARLTHLVEVTRRACVIVAWISTVFSTVGLRSFQTGTCESTATASHCGTHSNYECVCFVHSRYKGAGCSTSQREQGNTECIYYDPEDNESCKTHNLAIAGVGHRFLSDDKTACCLRRRVNRRLAADAVPASNLCAWPAGRMSAHLDAGCALVLATGIGRSVREVSHQVTTMAPRTQTLEGRRC